MKYVRLFAYITFCGLCISATLHVTSILAPSASQHLYGISLIAGIGAFSTGLPIVVAEILRVPPSARSRPGRDFARSLPAWSTSLAAILFCYVLINFVIISTSIGNEYPVEYNGEYFLEHNAESKQINLEEYEYYRASRMKLLTSFMMLYYLVATYYFALYRAKPAHTNQFTLNQRSDIR